MVRYKKKKIKAIFLTIFLLLLLIFVNTGLSSPEDKEPKYSKEFFWINFGIGAGSMIYGNISLSFQYKNNILSMRAIKGTVPFGEVGFTAVDEIGIMYGRAIKTTSSLLSLGIGIGRAQGWFPRYRKERSVIAVPLELQFFWRPFPIFGFGAYGFANINPGETFWGVCLCVQLGKLK